MAPRCARAGIEISLVHGDGRILDIGPSEQVAYLKGTVGLVGCGKKTV
jgi:hypothetical protein